jgi:hypothetical protein
MRSSYEGIIGDGTPAYGGIDLTGAFEGEGAAIQVPGWAREKKTRCQHVLADPQREGSCGRNANSRFAL